MNSHSEAATKSFSSFCSSKKANSHNDICAYDHIQDASFSVSELSIVDANVNHELQRPKESKSGLRMIYLTAMASTLSAMTVGYCGAYAGPATFDMQTRKSSSIKVTDDEVSWIGSVMPLGVITTVPLAAKESNCPENIRTYDGTQNESAEACELPTVHEIVDHQLDGEKHTKEQKSGCRMLYLCAMASMLSAVSVGFSSVYSGPATFDMQTRKSSSIKVTDDEVSWIGSVLPIGILPSIPLAVYLADRIGRKESLIFSAIPLTISWLIIIYAPNPFFLILGRFIAGCPLAMVYVILPMYAVEISSEDNRGLIGASFQASVTIGSLLSMGLGAVLVWSWLAVTGLVIGIIALIAFCTLPESPRWLISRRMKEKAIEVIEFLHGDKIDAKQECQMIENNLRQMQTQSKFSIENFKQPTVYKPALISLAQMFFIPFSGSVVVVMFTSMIFNSAGGILEAKYATVLVGAVQVVATLLSTVIVDRAGRRILLFASGFFMGISQAAVGTYFYVSTYDSTISSKMGWLPLASILFYMAMFSIGYGPIPWLMLSEMVPTRERGIISGVATLFMSGLAFVISKTFENLKQLINYHGVFWSYAVFCFLSCFYVYFFVPETKGKKLEEIQLIFSGKQDSIADVGEKKTEKASSDYFVNQAFSET